MRERRRVRFIRVFGQQGRQRVRRDLLQERSGGLTAGGIHSHVERPGVLDRKAARRLIELHRGNPKIGQDEIRARRSGRGEHLGQAGEVTPLRREAFRTKTKRAQPRFRFRQFDRVRIQA